MSNSNQPSLKRIFSSPLAWLCFAVFLFLGYGIRYLKQPPSMCPEISVEFKTKAWMTAKQYVNNLRPATPQNPNWGTYLDLSKGTLDTLRAYFDQNPLPGAVRVYLGSKIDSGYFFLSPLKVNGQDAQTARILYFLRKQPGLPCPKYCDISNTAMGDGGAPPPLQ